MTREDKKGLAALGMVEIESKNIKHIKRSARSSFN